MNVRVLDEHDVRRLLPMDECIEVMAGALASLARGVDRSNSRASAIDPHTTMIGPGTPRRTITCSAVTSSSFPC